MTPNTNSDAPTHHHFVGCVIASGTTILIGRSDFLVTPNFAAAHALAKAQRILKQKHRRFDPDNFKVGVMVVD